MSHLHVPDGLLPAWIILLGWIATGAILIASARRLRSPSELRHLPLLGVMAALMRTGWRHTLGRLSHLRRPCPPLGRHGFFRTSPCFDLVGELLLELQAYPLTHAFALIFA
jgi:hypothetical protein